jgi:hypothetical protein
MKNVLFTAFGKKVSKENVLTYMKVTGAYNSAKSRIVANEIIADHAKHENIQINDEALQTLSDLKRIQLGLHSSADMDKYLANLGIDLDVWEEETELELFRHNVKNNNGNSLLILDLWKFVKGIPAVRNHITNAIINYAKDKGLNFSDGELQQTSDSLRRLMDLHDADEFVNLINSLNMSEDDWEKYVHSHITLHRIDANEAHEIFNREIRNVVSQYPVIHNLASDIMLSQIIHAKAKRNKITVKIEDVQEYIDNFRRALGLHNLKSFNLWLEASGFHIDEFEYLAETVLLKEKFIKNDIELFDHEKIDKLILASSIFANALNSIKVYLSIVDYADKNNILVSDDDVNYESELLRRAYNLHNQDDFKNYLESNGISIDDWEWFCENAAVVRAVYKLKTDKEQVLNYLENDEKAFNMVKDMTFNKFINDNLKDTVLEF